MNIIKNPARARPLSNNVKRLMLMSRESPQNPDVKQVQRDFKERELAYCDMQGNIFMAAAERGLPMEEFAPLYMNSQVAGIMDHSFSCAGGFETDSLSNLLQIPMLLKSPGLIVDAVLWINNIVSRLDAEQNANLAIMQACMADNPALPPAPEESADTETLAGRYEYAYWLGFLYRYECLLHEESSRMVYAAFDEPYMKTVFLTLPPAGGMTECAAETARYIDKQLVGRLFKK